jgi:uncharacterized membrane protein
MLQSLYRNQYIRKFYFQRSEMEKWLIISCLFSLILVGFRICITGDIKTYLFLPWNLLLAYVPYFISHKLQQHPGWIKTKWKFNLVFIAWILFIPNSFYILTDLFHLDLKEESAPWFDLTMLLSFAWNGLLLGVLSVRQMEKIFLPYFGIRSEFFFLYPVMWLNAFGIYIGRYMRFNTWDVITNPFELFGDILYMLVHPFRHFPQWSMICCFSILMTIIYLSIKRIAKVI